MIGRFVGDCVTYAKRLGEFTHGARERAKVSPYFFEDAKDYKLEI